MKNTFIIDGKILFLGIVIILWLINFFVKTINIWLENEMLRAKYDYKKETEKKVYKIMSKMIKANNAEIIYSVKRFVKIMVKLKRTLVQQNINTGVNK